MRTPIYETHIPPKKRSFVLLNANQFFTYTEKKMGTKTYVRLASLCEIFGNFVRSLRNNVKHFFKFGFFFVSQQIFLFSCTMSLQMLVQLQASNTCSPSLGAAVRMFKMFQETMGSEIRRICHHSNMQQPGMVQG